MNLKIYYRTATPYSPEISLTGGLDTLLNLVTNSRLVHVIENGVVYDFTDWHFPPLPTALAEVETLVELFSRLGVTPPPMVVSRQVNAHSWVYYNSALLLSLKTADIGGNTYSLKWEGEPTHPLKWDTSLIMFNGLFKSPLTVAGVATLPECKMVDDKETFDVSVLWIGHMGVRAVTQTTCVQEGSLVKIGNDSNGWFLVLGGLMVTPNERCVSVGIDGVIRVDIFDPELQTKITYLLDNYQVKKAYNLLPPGTVHYSSEYIAYVIKVLLSVKESFIVHFTTSLDSIESLPYLNTTGIPYHYSTNHDINLPIVTEFGTGLSYRTIGAAICKTVITGGNKMLRHRVYRDYVNTNGESYRRHTEDLTYTGRERLGYAPTLLKISTSKTENYQ
jgi:hypothetical protein